MIRAEHTHAARLPAIDITDTQARVRARGRDGGQSGHIVYEHDGLRFIVGDVVHALGIDQQNGTGNESLSLRRPILLRLQ